MGSDVDTGVAGLAVVGRLELRGTAVVTRSVGTCDDVATIVTAAALVRCAASLRIGLERQTRGELVDGVHDGEDDGRPVALQGGAAASVDIGRVTLRTLAGWSSPRGAAPSGPAALGGASFAF